MRAIASFFLFLFLAGFIVAQTNQASTPTELTIENIFAEGGLTGRGPETIQWSPDNTKVSFVQRDDSGEHGALWYVDAGTGQKAVLVAEEKLANLAPPISRVKSEREKERIQRYSVAAYQWAPDSRHLLFDSLGQLWYYSLDSGTGVQMTSSTEPSSDPKFSPDGKNIAYIRKHNLFVRAIAEGNENQITGRETTSSEEAENLLNGEVDWVYAEELAVRSNYFWEPNGKHIVFLQMHEKAVPTYPLTDLLQLHPPVDPEKYPNPGDPNPTVRVGVVSSGGGKVKWISLTQDKDNYIPRFGWMRDGLLYVQVLNRAQNKLALYFVDANSGHSRRVLEETSPNWVEVHDDFKVVRVLKSGDHFLWSSWRDGYTHLYLYSFDKSTPLAADAKLERQLERGEYEVAGVAGADEATGTIYFTANKDDPRQSHLYSVKLDGSQPSRVTREEGFHKATFSDDGKYYVDDFSAVLTPHIMSLCAAQGACKQVWSSRSVAAYDLIPPKFIDFKADDGTVLYGMLLMPPQAANASPGSVPLIMNPYGGPHAQDVANEWGGQHFLFNELMAKRGFATLIVDNRGMGGRGQKFATAVRHHFGAVEFKDQLSSLDQVLAQFPVFDRTRLGWWGWSYGGFMTAYALTHTDRFKTGISVAPVTNWLDYDSIYTERYMGLPQENTEGYRTSSPVNFAEQLHGRLLLAHGTGDDNVHFQNSVQFVNALINAGKQFDFMIYPGKTHGISGPAASTHLFHLIQDHLERHLGVHSAQGSQ